MIYEIKRNDPSSCEIRCDECNIYIHEFSCSCPDFEFAFVICKHIHLVCSYLKDNVTPTDNLIINECNGVEKNILEKQLVVSVEKSDIESERNKALMLLNNMIEKCKSPSMILINWKL